MTRTVVSTNQPSGTGRRATPKPQRVASLFAGIGGIDEGLSRAGCFDTAYLCEWWPAAQQVLSDRFPTAELAGDIMNVKQLPPVDIIAGGFPCTDLSLAGRMAGIDGEQSGLVRQALRLADRSPASWLLLENVRNMLPLHRGRAMKAITDELSALGFRWAYRVVDSRFTGVPQRRQRVILLASRTSDPLPVLFGDDAGERPESHYADDAFGFYWTEGFRGLGWCRDAVPTLKGGSNIGIPSPPAIWLPNAPHGARIVTPGVEVGERLQGFPAGWTEAVAHESRGLGARWKMVGNAVTVGVAKWVGERLTTPGTWSPMLAQPLHPGAPWPLAAWGESGHSFKVHVSMWPTLEKYQNLRTFIGNDFRPLSHRAASGFESRLLRGSQVVPDKFRHDLRSHVALSGQQLN